MQKISPFLWFDNQAEQAANFYVSIFKNSKILGINRYGKAGSEVSGRKEGSVMTVAFSLDGQDFTALNGGPVFSFSQAISFVIDCKDQQEVDYFWEKLSKGGQQQPCGWLIDKYGVAWQVVPSSLEKMITGKEPKKAESAMRSMLQMKKIDIKKIEKAYGQ